MSSFAPTVEPHLTRLAKLALLVLAVVVLAGALHVAAVAVLPIVAALFLAVMFWPLRERLARVMPAWLAAGVCACILLLGLAAIVGWGSYASVAAADQFQQSQDKYVDKYESARDWLHGIGVPDGTLPDIEAAVNSSSGGLPDQKWSERLTRLAAGGLRSALGIAAALLLTVFLAYLALVEGNIWARWAREHLSAARFQRLFTFTREVSAQTRWYFLGKTISGVVSGGLTGLWLWAMGVPLAWVFAVFTLLMNYIPNVGALISGVPASLLAVVTLGWTEGLIVAAGLFAIETLVGNLLDPYIQGNMLRLSTFVVLASLIVWGWLWGVAGAIMAPVITAALITAAVTLGPSADTAADHGSATDGPA